MIRFIWRNWWRHKERLILLLIGVLIISSGLSYLIGLSETGKGTIVDTLRENWKAQYHILVRPPGSRSITENEGMLSPNYLSALSGGISLEQWKTVENLKNVSVAAPVAIIGYAHYNVIFGKIDRAKLDENAVYRLRTTIISDNGYRIEKHQTPNRYITKNPNLFLASRFFLPEGTSLIRGFGYLLLAGINPVQEAKLIGLDQAVVKKGNSRYFKESDQSKRKMVIDQPGIPDQTTTLLPVLLSNRIYYDTTFRYTLERLDLPSQDQNHPIPETVSQMIREKGMNYLDHLDGKPLQTYRIGSEKVYQMLVDGLTKQWRKPKKVYLERSLFKSGPVNYRSVQSPFPEKWNYAYKVEPQTNEFRGHNQYGFRKLKLLSYHKNMDSQLAKSIDPYFIGIYDPGQLHIAQSPLTQLPMQTYRPPIARLVLDDEGSPVNPPVKIRPKDIPTSFLLEPPSMLTTIQAAAQILGEQPISAIRVKVKGVHQLNEKSQQKLEAVAKQIREQTGLLTDITLGSSPQPALIHVPSSGEIPELGWVQMPWVKLGASFTIFHQTKLGFSGIILSVMLVGIAYMFAANLVSFLARRKELAVLKAVGWRPGHFVKMIFMESLLLGLFVAVISWSIEGVHLLQNPDSLAMGEWLTVGFLGLLIYLTGAIVPCILVIRLSPYEAIRTGEIRQTSKRILRSRGIIGMAFNHFIGKLNRNFLSLIVLALPTVLLAFFLFVTFKLKGILYTTWLGEYTAVQIGSVHYIAIVISLLIATLTTAEIMWQNVVERKPEIALLKAIGWRDDKVRKLVLLEGVFVGVLAGLCGVLLAFGLIGILYQHFPVESLWIIIATGTIPVIVGMVGSVMPAEIAVRTRPSHGLKDY